jgi:hypothetical protein
VERWGVPSSEIVIRYRFSQPQEGATLLWSRTHRLDSRNAGPEELHTLGDHLRRRRLTLKLPIDGYKDKRSVSSARRSPCAYRLAS